MSFSMRHVAAVVGIVFSLVAGKDALNQGAWLAGGGMGAVLALAAAVWRPDPPQPAKEKTRDPQA